MMTATARILLVAFLALPTSPHLGWAQAIQKRAAPPLPDSARKLVAVNVTGTKRYSPVAVLRKVDILCFVRFATLQLSNSSLLC